MPGAGLYLGVQTRAPIVLDLLARHGAAFRRAACRLSLCDADADDAFQRAALILLAKGDAVEPARLAAWMFVVTRREALAVRRGRERELLAGARSSAGDAPLDSIASEAPGPAERLERREQVRTAVRGLAVLKPQERRAILLQAQGYSYAEICEICGWTYTKVNRCLAEGRARLRSLAGAATAG